MKRMEQNPPSCLWDAHLILSEDFSLDEAVERGEGIANIPPPLDGIPGRPPALAYEN